MRSLITSMTLICIFLMNGVTSLAHSNHSKARVERKGSNSSPRQKQASTKRESRKAESRKEVAARRKLIKRNPRLASLFKGESEEEVLRSDQPREAIEWYLQKRLPKGEKQLPIERYFAAKEKIKQMKRFSTANNKNLPPQAQANDTEEVLDGEFPNSTGGGGAGDGSASTSGVLGTWQSIGPGNVGGRTRALLIDPTNPDVMYAAAVAGGIWKTTNAGATWLPLNDFLANIEVPIG